MVIQTIQYEGLGRSRDILRIKFLRDRKQRMLALLQAIYIDKILAHFRMHDSKKWFLPLRHEIFLSKDQCHKTPVEIENMKVFPYSSAMRSLMYAILCSRPAAKVKKKLFREP